MSAGSWVHPRQAPGYAEASAAGRLPVVPEQPPRLMVQPTAMGMFHRFVVLTFGGIVLVGALAGQVDRFPVPGWLGAVLMGLLALASFVAVILRGLPPIGDQSLAELEQGYTTLVLTFGGFWNGEGPLTLSGDMRAPWDYRGTWHLDHRDGRVLRAPDRSIDPPGMYPSPHQPGRLELWTGATWLGHFADPRPVWPRRPRRKRET